MRDRWSQFLTVVRVAGWRAGLARVATRALRRRSAPGEFLPVATADLLAPIADPNRLAVTASPGRPLRVAWVVPALWPGSGGHQDIFRIIRHLESSGHRCEVFLYDPLGSQSEGEFEIIARRHFSTVAAPMSRLRPGQPIDADALVATSWHTAYPVAANTGRMKRFYFVQDFEPSFYPVGSESVLAENTYRLGLRGITLGRWLSHLLSERYGMTCDPVDFQADLDAYHLVDSVERRDVLFYARPVSPRRAFELGLLALQLFALDHPETTIHLFGWELAGWHIPFPHVGHGILDDTALNQLYNRSAAGLVLSLTNLSLLPLELLAAGCLPVLNDGPNNRANLANPHVVYSDAAPRALANALDTALHRSLGGGRSLAREVSQSVAGVSWAECGRQFERILLSEMT